MRFEFRTEDHPAANGRCPQEGEVAWDITCKVEQGTLIVHLGQKGRDALITMLLEDTMIACNEQLPELLGKRILLYDQYYKRWLIAKLVQRENHELWEVDPKIYHPTDHARFTHWMELPEEPGATNVHNGGQTN